MNSNEKYFRLPDPDKYFVIQENLNEEEKEAMTIAIAGFGCVPDIPPVIEAQWLISVLGASIRYNDATPDYENYTEDELQQQINLLLKLTAHYSCARMVMKPEKQWVGEPAIVMPPAFQGSFWNLYNYLSVKLDRAFEFVWDEMSENREDETFYQAFADFVHKKDEQMQTITQYEIDYYEDSIGGGH